MHPFPNFVSYAASELDVRGLELWKSRTCKQLRINPGFSKDVYKFGRLAGCTSFWSVAGQGKNIKTWIKFKCKHVIKCSSLPGAYINMWCVCDLVCGEIMLPSTYCKSCNPFYNMFSFRHHFVKHEVLWNIVALPLSFWRMEHAVDVTRQGPGTVACKWVRVWAWKLERFWQMQAPGVKIVFSIFQFSLCIYVGFCPL